jgi:hypothetical protein
MATEVTIIIRFEGSPLSDDDLHWLETKIEQDFECVVVEITAEEC